MPSTSQSQRRLMGLALSVKRGKTKLADVPESIRKTISKLVRTMTEDQLSDYAKKVKADIEIDIDKILEEVSSNVNKHLSAKVLVVANLGSENVNVEILGEGDKKTARFKKQILKCGTFAHPQDPKKMLTYNAKLFAKIKEAFDNKVIDNVPILVDAGHDEEKTTKIAGRVIELVIEEDGLYAIMEIADEEVVSKIETVLSDGKGLIDEVSVSLAPVLMEDGTTTPIALYHVAIVTHAYYRGMNSFERLAASLKNDFENILIVNGSDLQKQIFAIRNAFYKLYQYRSGMYVEEIHDNFIIALDEDENSYLKFNYSIEDDGIKFEDPIKVEKTYMEVKGTLDNKELLAALKEIGIEIESIDDLKKKFESSSEESVAASVKAALEKAGVKSSKDTTVGEAIEALTAELNTLRSLPTKVEALEAEVVTGKADKAVGALVSAGKVLPAQKEHYIELYRKDVELFNSLTAGMPVVIQLGEHGITEGEQAGVTEGEIANEVARYISVASPNGKEGK